MESNMEVNQEQNLGLPPHYKGSKMFMSSGERLYWLAEVLPPSLAPAICQDYEQIKSRCLAEGVLFEDPEFPATERSLYEIRNNFCKGKTIEWRRPRELVENPQFYVDGYSRFDVNQGELNDCWMDASLANLTMHRKLFNQVVPGGQSFEQDYAGVFHFRFWQFGRWVDVVVDDRLPICEGKLIFLHSAQQNEFWSALLEKAYAKLYGSYQSIEYGSPAEAMEDFSGGLTEMYKIKRSKSEDLFKHLIKAHEKKAVITAAIIYMFWGIRGLIPQHAYSITSVNYVDAKTPMLRVRNPIGTFEWTGEWNDDSPKWDAVPQSKKEALGLAVKKDGEFWMSFKDFIEYFSFVLICNLNPESLYPEDFPDVCKNKWEMSMFEGKWVKGETAGGWLTDTYWCNPHYNIIVTDPDVGDDEDSCTVIIALMQKYKRTRFGKKNLEIGFTVHKVNDELNHLDEEFFQNNKPVYKLKKWISLREVSGMTKLVPGRYVVIPSTSEADEEGEFLLRVVVEKQRVSLEQKDVIVPSPEVMVV